MNRPALLSLDDALPPLLAQAHALTATQAVSTFDADGRVLAQDVMAALQVPRKTTAPWMAMRCMRLIAHMQVPCCA